MELKHFSVSPTYVFCLLNQWKLMIESVQPQNMAQCFISHVIRIWNSVNISRIQIVDANIATSKNSNTEKKPSNDQSNIMFMFRAHTSIYTPHTNTHTVSHITLSSHSNNHKFEVVPRIN